MRKFKVGDKIVCIETNTEELRANDLKHGKLYFVTDRNSLGVYVSDNSENCTYACDFRFKLAEEKDMEQTAEQIRDEILRIDARIEEAKKDIENADKERTALVEKLREKGFEIVGSNPAILPGDLVRIIGTQSPRHSENHVGKKGVVEKVDDSDVPYKVILSGSDEASNTWFNSDQVQKI